MLVISLGGSWVQSLLLCGCLCREPRYSLLSTACQKPPALPGHHPGNRVLFLSRTWTRRSGILASRQLGVCCPSAIPSAPSDQGLGPRRPPELSCSALRAERLCGLVPPSESAFGAMMLSSGNPPERIPGGLLALTEPSFPAAPAAP